MQSESAVVTISTRFNSAFGKRENPPPSVLKWIYVHSQVKGEMSRLEKLRKIGIRNRNHLARAEFVIRANMLRLSRFYICASNDIDTYICR